ncbi:MAG: GNAT family N-acetyltransferase [Micromonosporaceae bacterium]
MEYEVRRIRADEWKSLRRLRLEALKDSPMAFVDQYEEALTRPDRTWQDRTERSASSPNSATFVAVRRGEFVGMAACFVEERQELEDARADAPVSAHVVGVYVTPAHRGTGVADALMTAVLDFAQRDLQADRIRLFVTELNERAEAFYRRIGFVRTGTVTAYPLDPTYVEYELEYRGVG